MILLCKGYKIHEGGKKMLYKIWDNYNGWYLNLDEYLVNGYGKVVFKGMIVKDQNQFLIEPVSED